MNGASIIKISEYLTKIQPDTRNTQKNKNKRKGKEQVSIVASSPKPKHNFKHNFKAVEQGVITR